jgi:hypothetical protein
MAKEWILNQANMRWGLTRRNKVGAVSDEIRKCAYFCRMQAAL